MLYISVGLAVVFLWIVYLVFAQRKRQQQAWQEITSGWGKARTGYINFDKAALYHRHTGAGGAYCLSEQTLSDMDFEELFRFTDRTSSKVGQQYLYHLLNCPVMQTGALQEFDREVDFITAHADLGRQVQLHLKRLDTSAGYAIASLLSEQQEAEPAWFKWLWLDVAALLVCTVGAMWQPQLLAVSLLIAAFNVIFLSLVNKRYILQYSSSFLQLKILVSVARKLSRMNLPFNQAGVAESFPVFRRFCRQINILYAGHEQKGVADISQLPVYVFELIKSVLLIEAFTLFSLLRSIKNYQEQMRLLFIYVGSIDVAVSAASLRAGDLITCKPNLQEAGKFLHIKNGIHPLVKGCVPNSILMKDKGVLLTGSNMSGKTTFLRMIAINALLAQTLYTCFAEAYTAPVFRLHSSIRISDDVFEGKSYFFREVENITAFIEAVDLNQNLFLMDEIFKGTNTIERIASAKAILSYLNQKNNLVLVSSHDVELAAMLKNEYDLYHFTETVNEQTLTFDYRLHHGPLVTRNAIRILELFNLPAAITGQAKQISERLSGSQ